MLKLEDRDRGDVRMDVVVRDNVQLVIIIYSRRHLIVANLKVDQLRTAHCIYRLSIEFGPRCRTGKLRKYAPQSVEALGGSFPHTTTCSLDPLVDCFTLASGRYH